MSAGSPLQPLLDSPRLIGHVAELNRVIANERQRRLRFYGEITEEGKWEFINGEIVRHSPARNRHMAVTKRIARLLSTWVDDRQPGLVAVEKALCQFPRNDYEPDIVYFNPPKSNLLRADTLLDPVPDLIIESSPPPRRSTIGA